MLTSTDSIVSYPNAPRHVVHREDQWDVIDSEIRKRISEPVLPKSVIALFGTAGIGKSTFLRETLYPRIKERYSNLPLARIDFDKEYVDRRYDAELRGNILIDLIVELERASSISAEIEGLKRKWEKARSKTTGRKKLVQLENDLIKAFVEYVSSFSSKREKRPVIFVLDSVEQADRDVIGWFQEKIQAPTTDSGYVLWIMASRQPLDCQPFFLRPRYFWLPLEPFKEQQTRAQIPERPELVNAIQMISFGLPAATTRLAEVILEIEQENQKTLQPTDLEETQVKERLILSLEDLLKLKHYFGQSENQYLSRALEILSPLRLFNVAVVTELLPKWLPEYFKPATIGADALYEIQKMVQTRLVSWDRSRRGYVFEEPLRQIVALVLMYRQPEKYIAIQHWAADRYREWAKNVEAKRLDYIVEALYHKLNVLLLEKNENVTDHLLSILEPMVEGVRGRDEVVELKEQLKSDREFKNLLNPGDMEKLLLPLNNLSNPS